VRDVPRAASGILLDERGAGLDGARAVPQEMPMRIGVVAENPIERVLLAAGVLPTPLLETLQAMLLARSLVVASKLGVFEGLASEPLTSRQLAEAIGTDPRATAKLLNALVGARYLRHRHGRYRLTRAARRWLLARSRQSLHDNMLFRFLEWDLLDGVESFVRSGDPLEVHRNIDPEGWNVYQRGMRSLASLSADEVARRLPVPKDATTMLDIGGSHGYYAVCLCRHHPGLRATILDLPRAVEHAAPILAEENMGERVVHWAGDALKEDLGEETWDLVFICNLVHHFDDETNRALACRVARALRPRGAFAILEPVRPESPESGGQTGALLDLYFALTSDSGTWSLDEMADWQRQAGLEPRKPIHLRSLPGQAIQIAVKRGKRSGPAAARS